MLTACLPGLSRWQLQEETLQVPENQGVTSPVTKGLGPPPPRYLIPSDLVVFPPPPHHFLHRPGPQLLTQQSCNAGTTLHTCSSSPICLACPISRAPTADDLFKQREKALFLERQGAENIIKKKKKVFIVEIFTRGRSHFTKTNLLPAVMRTMCPQYRRGSSIHAQLGSPVTSVNPLEQRHPKL